MHTSWSAGFFYDLKPDDVLVNGFPLFHVAGTFVFGTSSYLRGVNLVLPTRLGMRNTEFIRNYWRFVEKLPRQRGDGGADGHGLAAQHAARRS